MSDIILGARRRWLHFFPDGTLEFLLVTRVLTLLLLLSTAIITSVDRPAVLVAITGLLWVDYLLTLWWLVQIGTDPGVGWPGGGSAASGGVAAESATALRRRRVRLAMVIALPSLMAALMLAPWPAMLHMVRPGLTPPGLEKWVQIIFGVLYLICLVPAYRGLARLGLGTALSRVLFLVPLVHWLALHRFIRRIEGQLTATAAPASHNLVVTFADITWILGVAPWIVIAVTTYVRGVFPSAMTPFCGSLFATLFAIVNLAAVEHIQRLWVAQLQKADD